jgi:hypothetical protein
MAPPEPARPMAVDLALGLNCARRGKRDSFGLDKFYNRANA